MSDATKAEYGYRVVAHLQRTITAAPETAALYFGAQTHTWGDLRDFSLRLAEALDRSQVGPGAPVGVVLRNRPAGIAAFLSVMVGTRCPVVISPIQPPRLIASALRELRPSAVVADPEDWSPEVVDAVGSIKAVGVEISSDERGLHLMVRDSQLRSGNGPRVAIGESIAFVVPTSGTTGPPKYVPIRWTQQPIDPDDAVAPVSDRATLRPAVQALSVATIGGLRAVLLAVGQGRSLAILERLDIEQWVGMIERFRPRRTGLPPSAMRMLLDARIAPERLGSLEAWVTGSAPLDSSLKAEFEEVFGLPVLVSYGATEFGGPVARWTLEDHRTWNATKHSSVGRAVPGVDLRVVDAQAGSPVLPGEQGLLEVRLEDATGGWMRTNDLARLDSDGFLFIDGRVDNVLVRGGFKVSLDELERIFSGHPAVSEVAAVAVSDRRLGEVPAAAVVLHADAASVSSEELLTWIRSRVAPYKVPTLLRVVTELPKSAALKVRRVAVQELFRSDIG